MPLKFKICPCMGFCLLFMHDLKHDMILHNTSLNKKLILLHFRHNIVSFLLKFANVNKSKQSHSRTDVGNRATHCFVTK